jgi:hypothetical protein
MAPLTVAMEPLSAELYAFAMVGAGPLLHDHRAARYLRLMSEKKRPNLSALYVAATSARSTEPRAVERRKPRHRP